MGYFPNTGLDVCVWNEAELSYPPRPDAQVVRYIGPVEPTDWQAHDEWRVFGDPPPLDPGDVSGLIWHLDAGTITPQADETDLATWTSVVGPSPSQGTTANQPHYRTNRLNGGPSVQFVKANTHNMAVAALGASLTAFTIVCVWRPAVTTGAHTIYSQDAANFSGDLLFGLDPEDTNSPNGLVSIDIQRSSDSTRHLATDTSAPSTTDFMVHSARYSGGQLLDLWRGREQVDTASTDPSGTTITNRAGQLGANPQTTARNLDGEIVELALWSTDLSDSDLLAVILGLEAKHALDLTV